MGIIREPEGIDFIVDSRPLNAIEEKQISDIISHYKKTGEITKIPLKKRKVKKEEKV
jgi:hypothetical protein